MTIIRDFFNEDIFTVWYVTSQDACSLYLSPFVFTTVGHIYSSTLLAATHPRRAAPKALVCVFFSSTLSGTTGAQVCLLVGHLLLHMQVQKEKKKKRVNIEKKARKDAVFASSPHKYFTHTGLPFCGSDNMSRNTHISGHAS